MCQHSYEMKRQRHGDPTQGDKGKKRKRKDESDGIATKELPRNVSTPQKVASGTHAEPAEVLSGFERMDEETTTYLNEVKAHLDTLVDMEEISLLVCCATHGTAAAPLRPGQNILCQTEPDITWHTISLPRVASLQSSQGRAGALHLSVSVCKKAQASRAVIEG